VLRRCTTEELDLGQRARLTCQETPVTAAGPRTGRSAVRTA